MRRQAQTRNLEIPGSDGFRHRPGIDALDCFVASFPQTFNFGSHEPKRARGSKTHENWHPADGRNRLAVRCRRRSAVYVATTKYQTMDRVSVAQRRLEIVRAVGEIPRYMNPEPLRQPTSCSGRPRSDPKCGRNSTTNTAKRPTAPAKR